MTFGKPSPKDFERDREWRASAAKKYAQKPRTPRTRAPSKARRNDAPWRAACEAVYGTVCIVPGCGSRAIEMDHIKPRAQGGKSVVPNGIPLCGQWSRTVPGGHHGMKTAGTMRFEWAWLTPEQRTYLASINWVDWDEAGKPFGEGLRHFEERRGT